MGFVNILHLWRQRKICTEGKKGTEGMSAGSVRIDRLDFTKVISVDGVKSWKQILRWKSQFRKLQ